MPGVAAQVDAVQGGCGSGQFVEIHCAYVKTIGYFYYQVWVSCIGGLKC